MSLRDRLENLDLWRKLEHVLSSPAWSAALVVLALLFVLVIFLTV